MHEAAPERIWSHEIAGAFPNVFLSPSRVLVHYAEPEQAERQEPTAMLCLHHEGRRLWSRPGRYLLTPLPGERYLVSSPTHHLLEILDRDGEPLKTWSGPDRITKAHRFGGRLALLSDTDRLILTDLELNPGPSFAWPQEADWADPSCLVGEHFYWCQGARLWRCDQEGVAEQLTEIPWDLVDAALSTFAEENGESPIEFWSPQEPPAERGIPQTWRLSYDPVVDRLFLTHMLVHMLLCLELDGTPRWCRALAPGCCSGPGHRLPNGLLVASAGCGQVLTWFDDEGRVVSQSQIEQGAPYSAQVRPLQSGLTLVAGGPGLLALSQGSLRWRLERPTWRYAVSEDENFLAMCCWQNLSPKYLDSRFTIEARRLGPAECAGQG